MDGDVACPKHGTDYDVRGCKKCKDIVIPRDRKTGEPYRVVDNGAEDVRDCLLMLIAEVRPINNSRPRQPKTLIYDAGRGWRI